MNYFDMLLAKNLGGGGGGGSLPFPYKIVHVKFTPPEDAVQTIVYAASYYDTNEKCIVEGSLYFAGTSQHEFDFYETSMVDIGEEGVHDFRWIFDSGGDMYLNFQYVDGDETLINLNVDRLNSVYENCTYDDDSGFVFIDDNATEATVTIAFEPIQS